MSFLEIIEKNEDLQIKTLQELVSIKSVRDKAVYTRDGQMYPFGEGVQKALEYLLGKAEEMGFSTENVDNYGGHIDFGYGEETVGIIGHLDVVPEGENWGFDPYSGACSNGYIYGRGTTDDKGPVVAALFAMKALKDAGYEPSRKIRLILGLDEETAWEGIEYYFSKVKKPTFGFTPDADFPAINGEKGMTNFSIVRKLDKTQNKGLELSKLSGGTAVNMVPEKARAVVRADDREKYALIRSQAENFRSETEYKIHIKGVGKSLEICADGKSAHGASPEEGVNAISVLMSFLANLNFANDDINSFIEFYNRYIGFHINGEGLGIDFCDEPSGKLTLNAGVVEYDKEAIRFKLNVRYPVTFNVDQIYDKIIPVIDRYGMGLVKESHKKPIYMGKDSPMLQTLMESYQKYSGDMESQPMVIGGGTYAKSADNIIGFGALFPGDEDLMHQKDERLSLERFMLTTKIYAEAIYRLSQPDFKL